MFWNSLKSVGVALCVVGDLAVGHTLATAEEDTPRIQMGETQPTSIMMIPGADTGELTLVIENDGELLT